MSIKRYVELRDEFVTLSKSNMEHLISKIGFLDEDDFEVHTEPNEASFRTLPLNWLNERQLDEILKVLHSY